MDKLVFVKELTSGLTKNQAVYPIVKDQDNERWYLFNGVNINDIHIQGSYLFTFEINEKGFKDIKKITPLTNLFQQKALKEVSNKNDIVRNLTVCLSYSKDLVIAGKIDFGVLYPEAFEMYNWLNENADKLMPQSENPFENNTIKEVNNENIGKTTEAIA
jgi:hypothetical protein